MNRLTTALVGLLLVITQAVFGSSLLLTCDVGGVSLEKYSETTGKYVSAGTLPRTFTVPQNDVVGIRVTAAGYKDFEASYEVNVAGTMHVNIALEPENLNPSSCPLFAIGGTATRKSGLVILAGSYTVKTVNLTTYKTPAGAGQGGQDSNPIDIGGYFCNTLANLSNNRAVAVGDKIYTGVYTNDLRRCVGYKVIVLTEEDIAYGGVEMNIIVK